MKIHVNNKEVEIDTCSSIDQLIALLDLPIQGIAVAVNNRMVPRDKWEHSLLHESDNVVIIKAACGG